MSSKEELEKFFDALGDLSPVTLHRNDPCSCGSGKKYKKCCLQKERLQASSGKVRVEKVQIKYDALDADEAKNNFPKMSEEDNEEMSLLLHIFREHPEKIDSENCDYFRQLNRLRIKYPDNPVVFNYLANGYQILEDDDRLKELIDEGYEKFPDYLFARIAKANIYLNDGFMDEAHEVLNGAYTLKQLYPNRSVFHVTEVRAFEYFMFRYFCQKMDIKQAELHFEFLEEILEEDDSLLQSARKVFRRIRGLTNFKAGLLRLMGFKGKDLDAKKEALRKDYVEGHKDDGQIEAIHEWL